MRIAEELVAATDQGAVTFHRLNEARLVRLGIHLDLSRCKSPYAAFVTHVLSAVSVEQRNGVGMSVERRVGIANGPGQKAHGEARSRWGAQEWAGIDSRLGIEPCHPHKAVGTVFGAGADRDCIP